MRSWYFATGLSLAFLMMAAACDKDDDGDQTEEPAAEAVAPARPRVPDQVEAECPTSCRTQNAGLGNMPRLAVWAVSYGDDDYVRIKNLSRAPVNLDGWYAVVGDVSVALPAGITIDEMAFVMFNLGQSRASNARNIFLEPLSFDPFGEFALFSGEDLTNPDNIQVYVRWGRDPQAGETTYMPLAAEVGLWQARGYVPVCEEYSRFGAVGSNALPRGFRSMADDCFPEVTTRQPSGSPR